MENEKALIIQLLRQNSSRIYLTEFKQARAEIWKHFRLVFIDHRRVPFVVCINCMKPVAYSKKTTGSLHKHPCAIQVSFFF